MAAIHPIPSQDGPLEPMASAPPSTAPRAAAPRCVVDRLVLTDFRSYADLRVETAAKPVVLYGENGAGKTNVLEAVSCLAPGRGLRGAAHADLARHKGAGGWAVVAETTGPDGSHKVASGQEANAAPGERRQMRLDGEKQGSGGAISTLLRLIWLTPAQDRLFTESPGGRRRFLDRLILAFDPDHAARVSAYEKAMRDRARLLKEGGADPAWLTALEAQMAERAVAIAAARNDGVARLARAMQDGADHFPHASLVLDGAVEQALPGKAAVDVEDWCAAELAQRRGRDGDSGRTSFGPHATDFLVTHLGKSMPAALCSTGEQKLLLCALVLAQARIVAQEAGMTPILLLDEVAAHLDEDRRAALFAALGALGAQSFVTGTDRSLFNSLQGHARFFKVSNSTLHLDDIS